MVGKISISENLVLRAGRQSALPFFVRFPVFSPPVLRPIGDPAPLLGMASPLSEGLPKREKCAMLHYIASSAGSAPDRMHRAGDASRDTLEGPSSLLPDLWRSVARQTCRRRSNSLSWHSARGQYTFPKNRDSEFSKISFNFPQVKFSKS